MPFEIRKISDVGTSHPVVARLGVQMSELLNWTNLDKAKQDSIAGLYIHTLTWRLLRCHKSRDEIRRLMNEAATTVTTQSSPHIREVPHVIGLEGLVGQFLYEAKNYLRDLLGVFQITHGCDLKDASAFADLKSKGDSDIVKWATHKFGEGNGLSKMLKDDQKWIGEIIRSRNAIEHPGGLSGTLTIHNIELSPVQTGSYLPPRWQRTGNPDTDILKDMDCYLDNLLTLAEDIIVEIVRLTEFSKVVAFYEIPLEARDPQCPVRIRVDMSPEMLAKFPRK